MLMKRMQVTNFEIDEIEVRLALLKILEINTKIDV